VVWNPWSALAATLPDLTPACWLTMLCIETANVASDAITLNSGEHQKMGAHIFTQQFAAGYTAE